jgi:hypothetical protein
MRVAKSRVVSREDLLPVLKNRVVFEVARGIKAFLNLEVGLTRGETPGAGSGPANAGRSAIVGARIRQVGRRLTSRGGKIAVPAAGAVSAAAEGLANSPRGDAQDRRVRPENVVWIFGSGRSGSTWLRSMMAEMEGHRVWEEPMVGQLFGVFHRQAQEGQLKSANFIMGEPTRKGWMRSIRNFVLDGAMYANPRLRPDDILVVKEPNGSTGAPLLMEALPESRMILLVRDPRDVAASVLDGARKGSWLYERKDKGRWKENALADTNPEAITRRRANMYMTQVGHAREAYEAHGGPKVLVRYEELRADTLGTMQRIYSELGMDADEDEVARAVEKHAWENIPEEDKGEGKFYRKATPGGWREDLTPKQAGIVEKITAPLLKEFYPEPQEARENS